MFENIGICFSSLEILQEPERREDQLKWWDLKLTLKLFWRLILLYIFHGWLYKITFFYGWSLKFQAVWRQTVNPIAILMKKKQDGKREDKEEGRGS